MLCPKPALWRRCFSPGTGTGSTAAGTRAGRPNGATGNTGLIRQIRSVGAGRLSWAGGSTAWTGPGRRGLPSQAARLRRAGAAATRLRFAGE